MKNTLDHDHSADSFDDHDQQDYYVEENDNQYWKSNAKQKESSDEKLLTLYTTSQNVSRCRRCHETFEFNNRLHRHLKNCLRKTFAYVIIKFEKSFAKVIAIVSREHHDEVFSTIATKESNSATTQASTFAIQVELKMSIIQSSVDSDFEIDIDYDFRDWSHAKANISLSEEATFKKGCLDTDVDLTLIDRQFLKSQALDVHLRIMIISLTVRDLSTRQHKTNEYVMILIFMIDINVVDEIVRAIFRREIHVVDDFKTNILIDNDIMSSKDIFVDSEKHTIHIESCKVIVSMKVKSSNAIVSKSIHLRRTTFISSRSEISVEIHHLIVFDKDYLFELEDISHLIIYAHLVNVSIKAIILRNESNKLVQISRNHRLSRLSEMKYANAYHIDSTDDARDLIARRSETIHKQDWFRRVMIETVTVFVAMIITMKSFADVDTELVLSTIVISSVIEVLLLNGVIIHNSGEEAIQSLRDIVEIFLNLWRDIGFVDMNMTDWMRISLKSDWERHVIEKAKIYSLELRDKQLVNDIFDELHKIDKLSWITKSTFFNYFLFCVWKTASNDEKKSRVVVDIRDFNVIIQFDVYSLSLQFDIIQMIAKCNYIIVVDVAFFFYQWRVHLDDRYKLIVISHRDQKFFNVAIMSYKNSSTYVQRQIDRVLREHRRYAKAYVDDVVIFSRNLQNHMTHLRAIFDILNVNNITIKIVKVFIDYLTMQLLDQRVDFFELVTAEDKLKTIFMLKFFRSLRQLKIYLRLIDWLREYVSHYVDVFKSLQMRKTKLLRDDSVAESARKVYSNKTRLNHSIEAKIKTFNTLQILLSKLFYLIHANTKRSLYVDLDASKEFDFDAMIYHVKEIWLRKTFSKAEYSSRIAIESILFLSRLLTLVETRYWSIELELVDIVWVLKKIRHLVEAANFDLSTIVYIDHDAALNIAKQISLITFFIDKLNLRLMRVSNYIQRFNLNIRHKFEKQHIVFDALSRLVTDNALESILRKSFAEEELDALFIMSLIKMNADFKQRILNDYKTDLNWQRVAFVLEANDNHDENVATLSFYREKNDLIFRFDDYIIESHDYESNRLCISHSVIQEMLKVTHDDSHFEYARCYDQIASSYYIRDLSRYLRDYLKHCSKCQIYQTRRHKLYDSLQSILTSSVSFHTIIIDFVLALSISKKRLNCLMSITCKYSKRILLVSSRDIFIAIEWNHELLDRLDMTDWSLSKVIIFDRDRKFFFEMWTTMFKRLNAKLFYSIAYHSQIDEQSERINQFVEIALRFLISIMKHLKQWSKMLSRLQRDFNNSTSNDITFNEIAYDFISVQAIDLMKSFADDDDLSLKNRRMIARAKIFDAIVFAQMNVKHQYDDKHQSLFMKADDQILIRLHRDYDIFFIAMLDKKLSQQFVELFKILKRIERLTYRLKLFDHWRIHLVLFVAQLKLVSKTSNLFNRSRSNHSKSVFVRDDIDKVKFYEVEEVVDKRLSDKRDTKYLIRWKEYDSEFDEWRNLLEMKNAMNLVREYEELMKQTSYLSGRLKTSSTSSVSNHTFFIKIISRKAFKSSTSISIEASFDIMIQVRSRIVIFSSKTSLSFDSLVIQVSSTKPFAITIELIKHTSSLRRSSRLLLPPP